ncbi:cell division protein FtsQ/DivIB [Marinobacterium sp. xm-a-127]|uniref:cell division protein FtsQ/DivIB n=1 Tax=unclassified Marinobacterium TaxID=2644139 RepID=UPI001A0D7AD8|nr:Cell division protein FtsQ [Marinobacterium sp. xm-d-420]NRP37102.1 Cell division protein FtsQ [Marinobacterium sp. xm-d-579]NRP38303.1 Cell division protein FtsQ [Marinobacterium sp. xm-a-121]NRP53223.1 Cell division protein FtsQ [Marinobacterium sp. xm-v-242]NRP57426.1 Cell division protein FtsQ [Marinobacterium sp. xm-d-510]NRP59940.1 Cell division protein FtsQ [Marinobacterium sp. xm-d-564]NRP78008.1 Cell division protein FtsQ [Marinobacterium sp. xm-m-383]NRP95218.1 Cell division pro
MAFSLPWKKTIPTQVAEIVETQQSAAQEAEILFERADRLVESEVANESDWIWKPVLVLTICGILLSLIFTAVREYTQWLNRPVETVVVDGATRHIDKTVIANQVAAGINGRILELDLGAIQERLVEEPWINEVEVRRAWPPALQVKLIEEVPVARWGNRGLLNHQGDIFWPERVDAYQALPELSGPSHETVRIMQQFRDLNSLFIRSGITLAGLELESRGAWTLHLNNGIKVVAGRDDLMPRLRRFIQVYETQLVKQQESIEEVDIRYTNGVAVKWKKGSGTKRS